MTRPDSPRRNENNECRAGALFKRAGKRDLPEAAYFGPAPRRVEGPKSATERSHEGGANVAEGISRSPARDMPFAIMILGIFTVKFATYSLLSKTLLLFLSDLGRLP